MSYSSFNNISSRFESFCTTNVDRSDAAHDADTRPDTDRIPQHETTMTRANETPPHRSYSTVECCCGRPDCAYLEHNNLALCGIERDLETAARLGQALLSRHESFIHESQVEHARLSAHICELEGDRSSLQTANEKIVAENRDLLARLETLNNSLAESDGQVRSLEHLLHDCEVEVKRLHGLVRRTEELESKILDLERDRLALTQQVADGEEEYTTTIQRWRNSERKVKELEDEVQKIELEARREKQRHEEIIAKFENERTIEKEMSAAEGRLKGAAAVQGLTTKNGGTNVVSHFVRDILQDNANLQSGILELKELLQVSNEEVQNLREQIMQHQPVDTHESTRSLSHSLPADDFQPWNEEALQSGRQQEVHVHHHYHAKLGPKKERTVPVRRNSKRKVVLGMHTSPESSMPSTPRSGMRPQRFPSSPIPTTGLHQPQSKKNRWSMQSTATTSTVLSSFPSSPRSYYDRNSSLFDRMEGAEDSSRPTSPESSAGYSSPRLNQAKKFSINQPPYRSFDDIMEDENVLLLSPGEELTEQNSHSETSTMDETMLETQRDLTPKPSQMHMKLDDNPALEAEPEPPDQAQTQAAISHRDCVQAEDEQDISEGPSAHLDIEMPTTLLSSRASIRPSIRRTGSHESLVSISGMDIHLARRPAISPFTLLRGNSAHFANSPSVTRKMGSVQPLASVTEHTATFTSNLAIFEESVNRRASGSNKSTSGVTSSMEVLSGLARVPITRTHQTPSKSLGRLVGSWVKGKWGIAPVTTSPSVAPAVVEPFTSQKQPTVTKQSAIIDVSTITTPTKHATTNIPPSTPAPSRTYSTPSPIYSARPTAIPTRLNSESGVSGLSSSFMLGRSPGINQKGTIPGVWIATKAPTQIQPHAIDHTGLREGLEG